MKLFFESVAEESLKDIAIELAKGGMCAYDISQNLEYNYGIDSDTAYAVARDAEQYVRYELNYFEEDYTSGKYFNEDLANYFQILHDSDYNWNRHNCDYTEFYDELNTYLKPGESVDAEDEAGYPLDSNVDLKTLFRRMPRDKQVDFIDRFDKMNESLKRMNEAFDRDLAIQLFKDVLENNFSQHRTKKAKDMPKGLYSEFKIAFDKAFDEFMSGPTNRV